MSYLVQSQMVNDRFIIERAGACAAGVGIAGGLQWAARHALDLVVSPGWVEAYTDAGGLPDGDPAGFTLTLGARPDVITDQMILDAVCRLAGIPLPAEPEPAPEPETAPEPELEPEHEDGPEDEVEPAPPELPHTDGDTPVTDTESPA